MSLRQPIQLNDLNKSHMKRGGLFNKHVCKKNQTSPLRQQKYPISTFYIISKIIRCHSKFLSDRNKAHLFVPPTERCFMCNMERIGFTALEEKSLKVTDAGRQLPVYTYFGLGELLIIKTLFRQGNTISLKLISLVLVSLTM